MCKLPLCVAPPFLVFFGNHNSLFLLAHYNALEHQEKNEIDFGVYSKKIIVKKLLLVTVPDFQQSHLQIAWEFVFRTGCTN